MKINQTLSEIVSSRGIKQRYISQKTGISEDIISKILRGDRRILADEFLNICFAIEVDPNIFRRQKTA